MLSLNVIVEPFCFALADGHKAEHGFIVAERRDEALDSALLAARRHLREPGTSYLRPAAIRDRILQLRVAAKTTGIPGLELADFVVSPIGRHAGAGLVILPKE